MEDFMLNLYYSKEERISFSVVIPKIYRFSNFLKIEIDSSVFDYIEFNTVNYFQKKLNMVDNQIKNLDEKIMEKINEMNNFSEYITYLMLSAAKINFLNEQVREGRFDDYKSDYNSSLRYVEITDRNEQDFDNKLLNEELTFSMFINFYQREVENNGYESPSDYLKDAEKNLKSRIRDFSKRFNNFYESIIGEIND